MNKNILGYFGHSRIYRIHVLIIFLMVLSTPTILRGQIKVNTVISVWDASLPFPDKANMAYPKGVKDIMVHRSGSDEYDFLHDAAIVNHKGVLYAAWYNCPSDEMQEKSSIRGRRSYDNGHTWSKIEIIASDTEKSGIMYVPVSFLSYNDTLFAFISNMVGGPDLITKCEVFVLNEKTESWKSQGFIADLFLPNSAPIKMGNGNFIMAGRMANKLGEKPTTPAIVISNGDQLTKKWSVIPMTYNSKLPDGENPDFPESTLLVDKSTITAFVRNHSGVPLLFKSSDYGQNWSDPQIHNFPFASSKITAGTLTNGQNYVLSNIVSDGYRDLLTISVTNTNGKQFSKIWKIRDGNSTQLNANPEWSYPSATEYNGNLYVVYTSEKKHCCLTIIPIDSLKVASNEN